MTDDTVPRRQFLLGAGLAGTALAAGLAEPAQAQQPKPEAAAAQPAPEEPFVTLTAPEAAFIVAAVDTLIPADELSPSGSECGCAVFIDRQLGSAWGGGAKMYRGGPYLKGKPEQGYQLALTPREYFSAGIAAANAWTRKTHGKDFDRLDAPDRVTALKAMEEGKAQFENFDARAFFAQLHGITMAGFFADPVYGGNRDKVGWKLLGFPGLPATYADKIDTYRDKRYVAEPQSIADFS
ncbi:gluconate 2-dehydrogenase subunit 3 family protein [Bradyrhizobium sp. NP1]|uniref:gluconate 2-dehydrogenase subunit 3 family protein n=1 Tax=Bradyrhizobium sp. NP1 TaxID=3049772 RepID=UPI0025A67938|nr:gluconate 2-dehydrogenase subunit 3 family protein [Bradyrhizobium sp. NP1]WJR78128.1 gluconate 2-dehydrogenase subunit 3 family protein [Bradyrhizobium sp. NP1]